MKALIDPNVNSSKITSYDGAGTKKTPYIPVFTTISNSGRVCQVEPDDKIFEVAHPLFWTDCADNVVAYEFYYDINNKTINPIVNVLEPTPEVVVGVQTV